MGWYKVNIVSRINVRMFLFCLGLLIFVFNVIGEGLWLKFWVFFVLLLLRISQMISFVGYWTLWFASWESSFLSSVRDGDVGWLLLFGERLFNHIRCSIITVGLHLLCSLGRWNVEYVSFEHTVMSSSGGLLFLSTHGVCAAAARNRNTESVVLGQIDGMSGPICLW